MFRILIPIILIIAAGLVGFFYIKPLYFETVSSLAYKMDIDNALQKNKEIEETVVKLRADISSISQSDFDKLEVILPDNIDKIRLLNDINTITLRHGIPFNNLSVNESEISEEISDKIDGKKATLKALLIKFTASTASYNTFKLFLEDIERSMKLMDINSISFSAHDPDAINPSGSYSYDVSFNAYWIE